MNFRTSFTVSGVLLFVLFSAVCGYAQKKSESYKVYKKRAEQKSVTTLLAEASAVKESNPREALNLVEEALGLSLAQEDAFHEGKCYMLLGEINEGIEEWKLALENYTRAYARLSNAYTTSSEFKRTLQGLGTAYLKLNDYDQSLHYFQEALSLKLDFAEQAERILDVSEVYYQRGDYAEALKTVDNIRYNRKVADQALEIKIQNQKAKIYARMNELDKAKKSYSSAQNTLREKSSSAPQKAAEKEEEISIQSTKEEISDVLKEQKRYDEEIDLRNQSIEYNLESNNLAEVSKDKVQLGKALAAKGETREAIKALEEAAHIADTIGDPKEQAKAFLALADLYEKNRLNTQALSAYKKFSEAVAKAGQQNENQSLEHSALIKKQRDIEELSKAVTIGQREETIERATVFRQQLVIYGLLLIILIIIVTSYFIYKNAQASKTANQLLALKSLRSQMNPHFIFNALNSVNHFVSQHDERTANKFLSEFSRLMRLVLENSQEDFIPLFKEEEIISLYLKLEHYRFRDKFEYAITIDDNINKEAILLPPMLIQPYIENAVWHGLRYKESKGLLNLAIRKHAHNLIIEIMDNGIGRRRSAELKTDNQRKHQSTGLKNIQERLRIINNVYKAHYQILTEDLDPSSGTGTKVSIYIPTDKRITSYEGRNY